MAKIMKFNVKTSVNYSVKPSVSMHGRYQLHSALPCRQPHWRWRSTAQAGEQVMLRAMFFATSFPKACISEPRI